MCTECAAGKSSSSGSSECQACGDGKVSNADNTQCETCEAGKFAVSGDVVCENCGPGRYADLPGTKECQSCSRGFKSLSFYGSTGCEQCTAGKFAIERSHTCHSCIPGTFSGAGAFGCTVCGPGKISVREASSCFECQGGKYATNNHAICSPCGVGYFSSQGADYCIQCPEGKHNPITGSDACLACAPGTFNIHTGQGNCQLCEAGSYNPHNESLACTPCAKGKFNPDLGSNSSDACLICPSGTFNARFGQKACTPCFEGSFSNEGSTDFTDCHCAPGSKDSSWAFKYNDGQYYLRLDPDINFVDNGAKRTEWSAVRLKDTPSLDSTNATVVLDDYTFANKGTQSWGGGEQDDTFFQHSNGNWYMKVDPNENWSERTDGAKLNERTYFHAVRLLSKPSQHDDHVTIVTDDYTFATGARNQKWMSAYSSNPSVPGEPWDHDTWFKIDLSNTPLTLEGSSQPTCCFGDDAKSGSRVNSIITESTATMNAGGTVGYTCIDYTPSGAEHENWECAPPLYTYHSVV